MTAKKPAGKAVAPKMIEAPARAPVGGDLPPKHRAFVAEYMKDKNATQAYIRVYGVSQDSAEASGPRLLGDVRVKAEIVRVEAEMLAIAQQEAGLTLDRLLRELARGAFFDVRKLLDADGHPLSIHLLDDDTASAIAGLEIETRQGRGEDPQVSVVRKYKLADRKGYVDMGLKVVGGYAKDNDQTGKAAGAALLAMAVRFVEPGKA